MMKSAKTCHFIAFFGLYLMSNSLDSIAHFISLPESSVCVALASSGILLEFQWYELESKGGASGLRLLMPRLIPSFRSLSMTRTVLVEKSETTKYRVRSSPSEGLTRMGGELKYVFNAKNASSQFVSH